jgi:hypothetical protein
MYNEELDAYCKKLLENSEAFLNSCGKKAIEIYRIEDFTPVEVPEKHHGEFFDGDSYVCVMKGNKAYEIHYWEGVDSTADETGSAAALTTQLSERLPMPAKHHLELQNEESDLFLSHFPNGIKVLHGGVDSGFKHFEKPVHEPELLMVKGKRFPRLFTLEVKASNLNHGDVFVLDLGEHIYIYQGKDCSEQEKVSALNYCINIKDHMRQSHCKIDYPMDMGGDCEAAFWAALGGSAADVQPATPDDESKNVSEADATMYRLWHVSDASGSMQCEEIQERPLRKDMLLETDTYILELYNKIYAWQGKNASTAEKHACMNIAAKYRKEWNKPKGTSITRIPQGIEDALFISFFEGFYLNQFVDAGLNNGMDVSIQAKQDISALANQHLEAAKLMLNDLGADYTVTVYQLIDDCRKTVKVEDPDEMGRFFNEEAYIVDVQGSTHRYMICWQGQRLSGEKIAHASEAQNVLCDGILSSNMTRSIVHAGQEPENFLQFFPHGFVVLNGARMPLPDFKEKCANEGAMFRCISPYGNASRMIQQEASRADLLDSYQAYVIMAPGASNVFCWKGKQSSEVEWTYTRKGAERLCNERFGAAIELEEGAESDEFWAAVGGKGDYVSTAYEMIRPASFEPMLFEVSNKSGYMHMTPIPAFTQQCLFEFDVYVLDVFSQIFIWIGKKSNKFEKNGAYKKTDQYIAALKDGRTKDKIVISEVEPGHESPFFKIQFPSWSSSYAERWLTKDESNFDKFKKQHSNTGESASKAAPSDIFAGFKDPVTTKYPLAELQSKFPEGVKGTHKEYYLSDEDFQKCFNMNLDEWKKLKQWKQQDLKKKVKLF